jgi:hypothetical protein
VRRAAVVELDGDTMSRNLVCTHTNPHGGAASRTIHRTADRILRTLILEEPLESVHSLSILLAEAETAPSPPNDSLTKSYNAGVRSRRGVGVRSGIQRTRKMLTIRNCPHDGMSVAQVFTSLDD